MSLNKGASTLCFLNTGKHFPVEFLIHACNGLLQEHYDNNRDLTLDFSKTLVFLVFARALFIIEEKQVLIEVNTCEFRYYPLNNIFENNTYLTP